MTDVGRIEAPFGYDTWTHTEVKPKTRSRGYDIRTHERVTPRRPPPNLRFHWTIGPVVPKTLSPGKSRKRKKTPATGNEDITVQLTADQQVSLSISGEDAYNNPVEIGGDIVWESSDESIVIVEADRNDSMRATAAAVGPAGTAAVTVTNDANRDGTGDFMGSLAIDVVAGQVSEIVINADEPVAKRTATPQS